MKTQHYAFRHIKSSAFVYVLLSLRLREWTRLKDGWMQEPGLCYMWVCI